MKKLYFSFILLLIFALVSGCEEKTASGNADFIKIYYVNKDVTGTVPVDSDLRGENSGSADDRVELAQKIMEIMSSESDSLDYIQAVPTNIVCRDIYITSDILNLVFDEEYYNMDPLREILCRQALVATFVQIDGVRAVKIYAGSELLKDANGETVGIMTADSFVVNPGKQINSINNATITLYFANPEGNGLVAETQSVYYNSNVPMEKLILEHLIAGPKSEGLTASVPPETGISDLTVADGVCYVSLDSGFEKYNYNVNESVVIYSIVDSLTELSYVDRVQISINGDSSRNYRDDVSLSVPFERDMTFLSPVKETSDRESVIVNDVE